MLTNYYVSLSPANGVAIMTVKVREMVRERVMSGGSQKFENCSDSSDCLSCYG